MLHNFSDAITQIINYIDFARNVDIHNPPKVPGRNKGKVKMAEIKCCRPFIQLTSQLV